MRGSLSQDLTDPEHSEVVEMLGDVVDAAESAARLTAQLLAYVGRGEPDANPIELSALVGSLEELLAAAVPKRVALRFDLRPGLASVMADAAQVEQVVLNLLRNAVDSQAGDVGEILVSTGQRAVDSIEIESWIGGADLAPGDYVFLRVGDNGQGMDSETIERIFDPFFTTKTKGHGLGLSAALGMVRAHGGAISIESAPGRGTSCSIHLPAVEARAPVPAEQLDDWKSIGATILIVDDEPAIRRLAGRLFQRAGCETLDAVDGEDAIEKFSAHADAIDLVLLDLSMPRMGGLDVLRQIHKLKPNTPVLLASGYDEEGAAREVAQDGIAAFISKPYRERGLIEQVRQLLLATGDPRWKPRRESND